MGFTKRSHTVVGLLFLVALFSVTGCRAGDDTASSAVDPVDSQLVEDAANVAAELLAPEEGEKEKASPMSKVLDEAQKANVQLGKDVKKARTMNLAFMGLGAGGAAGATLALLGALRNTRGVDGLTPLNKAFGVGTAGIAALSTIAAAFAYLQKQKAEQKVKGQVVELLKLREKMMKDLAAVDAEAAETSEKEKKLEQFAQYALEDIGEVADKMGVYYQEQD